MHRLECDLVPVWNAIPFQLGMRSRSSLECDPVLFTRADIFRNEAKNAGYMLRMKVT
jgi:hypothetical protein